MKRNLGFSPLILPPFTPSYQIASVLLKYYNGFVFWLLVPILSALGFINPMTAPPSFKGTKNSISSNEISYLQIASIIWPIMSHHSVIRSRFPVFKTFIKCHVHEVCALGYTQDENKQEINCFGSVQRYPKWLKTFSNSGSNENLFPEFWEYFGLQILAAKREREEAGLTNTFLGGISLLLNFNGPYFSMERSQLWNRKPALPL